MIKIKNKQGDSKMKKIVAIVGGGAAGLMAAGVAAQNGADVILFEKNEKTGRKIDGRMVTLIDGSPVLFKEGKLYTSVTS